jgi:hypothetical protein
LPCRREQASLKPKGKLMHLRKETGGSSIGGYEWPHDGSVTEVPDEFGRELLAIPDGGFERVRKAGEDEDEDRENAEFTEVVEVGYVLAADAPSTPGEGGQVPDRLGDRSAYRVTEDGAETVPPGRAPSGEHPRTEEPGEGRAGVKDVDRAERPDGRRAGDVADGGRDGREGRHEAGRPGEPKRDDGQRRRDRSRKPEKPAAE